MWVFVGKHWYFRDRHDYARRDYIGLLRQYGEQHPNKDDKVKQAILAIQQDPEYTQAEKTSRVFSERKKKRSAPICTANLFSETSSDAVAKAVATIKNDPEYVPKGTCAVLAQKKPAFFGEWRPPSYC